ncbi:MAG: hypothetical protein JSU94_13635 [Phycisphaerales bacterium]|nr:MAG: hypothetical protein JSU94_13635 [Phycisphaerales bacterium]
MRHRNRQPELQEQQGAPEWMVTFSDCMTLLLTFFVLLLSFSSFDEKVFFKAKVIFTGAMHSVNPPEVKNKDTFLSQRQIEPTEELDTGSEKTTLNKNLKEGSKEETEPVDFRSQRVLLISSANIFWGKGAAISSEGRTTLSVLASFLKEASLPGRVVISENGPGGESKVNELGLERAWAVVEYLARQGTEKSKLGISMASSVSKEDIEAIEENGGAAGGGRTLEIAILDRSICN